MGVIAQNVAHAVWGYKSQDLPDFEKHMPISTVRASVTRAGHLGANGEAALQPVVHAGSDAPSPNLVPLESETVKAAEVAEHQHMAL